MFWNNLLPQSARYFTYVAGIDIRKFSTYSSVYTTKDRNTVKPVLTKPHGRDEHDYDTLKTSSNDAN